MRYFLIVALAISSVGAIVASADSSTTAFCNLPFPGYALQSYRDYESQMLQWNQRYDSAPSGSYDQSYADQQRRNASSYAISSITAYGALSGYPQAELESFARDLTQRYGGAPSGSFVEQHFRQAMGAAWPAFVERAKAELSCIDPRSWQQIVDAAENVSQKYNGASSGSMAESSYRDLMYHAWSLALSQIRVYLDSAYYENFRNIENLAIDLSRRYSSAPSGTQKESFYRDAMYQAFDAAFRNFRNNLVSLLDQDLFAIEREYSQRYNSAPSGSRLESYVRSIRDEARAELARRNANPFPPAPVPPPPPPVPPVFISCTVTTARGNYIGSGRTHEQATASARSNCLRYEPSYACNAGSVVCRGGL